MTAPDLADLLTGVLVVILTVVGLFLAESYRRKTRVELAESRLQSYAQLWALTGEARPSRIDSEDGVGPLTSRERAQLAQAMSDWYFERGAGLLLEPSTRDFWLRAVEHLRCNDDDPKLTSLIAELKLDEAMKQKTRGRPPREWLPDQWHGAHCIRQLSLLRTQLKADLAIYGVRLDHKLTAYDNGVLRDAKIDLRKRPWSGHRRFFGH